MKIKPSFFRITLLSLTASLLIGCSGGEGSSADLNPNPSQNQGAKAVVTNYATVTLAVYEDSLELAEDMNEVIQAFVAAPTSQNFLAAKEAWRAAREVYGQSEVYRFYSGPIDDADGPEGLINAWPIDESQIDYTQTSPNAGIVNNAAFTLTKENLAAFNERDAENAISTGFHAIEFLLWGQDLNATPTDSGLRPYTDYVVGAGGTHANQARRKTYLSLISEMLVEDLESVVNQWKEGDPSNYRSSFLAAQSNEAIRRIIVGMGSLAGGELSGQRMSVALETVDQEDEHSCFSDNTHRDIVKNFQGIRNVFTGTYIRSNGETVGNNLQGFNSLVKAVDATLNTSMTAKLNAAQTAVIGISTLARSNPPVYFDQQIQGTQAQRDQVQTAITNLEEFTNLLSQAADKLNININLDPDGE